MAIKYVDPDVTTGGNNANTGNSFAQRQRDFSSVTTAPGDTVRVKESPHPYRVQGLNGTNANGTFTNLDDDIAISETFCKIVNEGNAAFTAAANVTCATNATTFKSGTAAAQFTVAAGFTTGLAAHAATVTGDYSNCDRISFWLIQTSGTAIPASTLDIRLCSDTAGAVVVDTFTIPFSLSADSNIWIPIVLTRNGGGNLGASIQSVSIAFTSDPGAVVILLDNIIATNATGINHHTLVGKSSSATDISFYPVRTIAATNIKIESDLSSSGVTAKRGYSGVTETVAIYARTPLITYTAQTTSTNGVGGSRIVWSGGWNATDMSTQTGVSYILKLPTGVAAVLAFDSRSHFDAEKLVAVGGWLRAFSLVNAGSYTLTNCGGVAGSAGFSMAQASTASFVNCVAIGNTNGFIITSAPTAVTFTNCEAYNNSVGFGLNVQWTNPSGLTGCIANNNGIAFNMPVGCDEMTWADLVAKDNTTAFAYGSGSAHVNFLNPTTSGNTSQVWSGGFGYKCAQIWDANSSEADSLLVITAVGTSIRFSRFGGVQGDERERVHEGWIKKVDAAGWAGTGHVPTGSVWRLQPNSNASVNTPLISRFIPQPLQAGSYTLTLQTYRTNANVTGKLVVKGGRTDGIPSDVSSSLISAAINTNEQLSVSITVDTEGPVYVEFHAYFTSGSTGEVWYDLIGGI